MSIFLIFIGLFILLGTGTLSPSPRLTGDTQVSLPLPYRRK